MFIPKTVKVGFNNRSDTYTGKLAYVIYYDDKGVLRKEHSWEQWRNKGIEPEEFENLPTSGFVLNKKAGGTKYSWNNRNTYARVYDPRGFEFEITIDNLLFILANTDCTKGKGLEGEFVYSWDGKDLVLLPIDCNEYKEITQKTTFKYNKVQVKAKDLVIGKFYKTKEGKDITYLGKRDYYEYERNITWYHGDAIIEKEEKHFCFGCKEDGGKLRIYSYKSISGKIFESDVEGFSDILSSFETDINKDSRFVKISNELDKEKNIDIKLKNGYWGRETIVKIDNKYITVGIEKQIDYYSQTSFYSLTFDIQDKFGWSNITDITEFNKLKDACKASWKYGVRSEIIQFKFESLEELQKQFPCYEITKYLENGEKYKTYGGNN